jgi:succinate dehydrogenase / fumarate reductase flavoprotein subunit
MGGIRVDAESQMTRVPGLFACGECGAGLHGANRLGGNSLSDLLVFGQRAGVGAAEYVRATTGDVRPDDEQVEAAYRHAVAPLNRAAGANPYVLHEELQDVMGDHVGIVRTAEDLTRGIERIGKIRNQLSTVRAAGSSQYNPGWHEALAIESLVTVSEAVAHSALMREESRGAHTRLDHPGERDEWLAYNVVVRKATDGRMEVEKIARPPAPAELRRVAQLEIEDLEREIVAERAGRAEDARV